MFLVVFDYGYDGYNTATYDTLDEVADQIDGLSSGVSIYEIYEIKREVSITDIEAHVEARKVAKQQARQNALAKLTPEDCELLGITP